MTYKHVNEGLVKLARTEAERAKKLRAMEEKRNAAEAKKAAREAVNKQWKADLKRYQNVEIPAWHVHCAEIVEA